MNRATHFTSRRRQSCLGSLCLAVFIYCQAWCWSAILFVLDPLPAATKPGAWGRNLDEACERTSTFWHDRSLQKRSLPCFWLPFNTDRRHKEARWWTKAPVFSGTAVTCVFPDLCGTAGRNEGRARSRRRLCTAPWRGQEETAVLKRGEEMRGLGLILHVQPPTNKYQRYVAC